MTRRQVFPLVVMATLLLPAALWGCGGGGGAPPPPDSPPESPQLPPDVPWNAYQWMDMFRPGAPVMTFGDSLHVGADVAPATEILAVTHTSNGIHNGAALSKGHVRDGVGAEDVAAWLRVAASHTLRGGSVSGLATYHDDPPPTVVTLVYGEETRNRFTRLARLTQDAVGVINTGLPFEQQIRFNPHISSAERRMPGSPRHRTYDEILVWFIPKTDPRYPEGVDPAELGRTKVFFNTEASTADIWEVDEAGAAFSSVLIDLEAVGPLTDADVTHVLIHELLHALGFVSHTDPARFDSVLNDAGFYAGTQPRSLIYPIDREGLQAAYSRLKPGASPDEISAGSLGPWGDTSFHLRGDLDIGSGEIAFGVAFRNGLAQPWAFGSAPAGTLYDNPDLTGNVTWNGALAGITPTGRSVLGDASLTIGMGDLLGHLDFAGMRFESGGTWGDGDLHYAIKADVRGNTFRRADAEFERIELPGTDYEHGYVWSGEDLGTVTGAFFGPDHEGMGGVLERHDLSAAFGGGR